MPSSSVNFIRQFVPALERVDGNLALDVNVDGTVAKPSLSGSADMKINAARFANPTLPAVTNFNARLVFAEDRLDFEQFRGELAGGPFTLSGRITFPKLTEPNFDLQLRADAVLVARNDDLTARTDADIRVERTARECRGDGNGRANEQPVLEEHRSDSDRRSGPAARPRRSRRRTRRICRFPSRRCAIGRSTSRSRRRIRS